MRLVVVGGGPLCTYALERLAALLPGVVPPEGFGITVLERTGRFGAGAVHSDVQPATSVMNRVAAQIALAADETTAVASRLLPREQRPTFLEWAAASGWALGPREAPPRRMHGRALRAAFDRYTDLLRALDGVTVELVADEAVDVVPLPGGDPAPFEVQLASGEGLPADRVLLATGHSCNRPTAGSSMEALVAACAKRGEPVRRFVRHAYPLAQRLDVVAVPPGCRVGLLGLGLTAIDVALHLTEGRGGRFIQDGDGDPERPAPLAYVPSGDEPAVLVGACPSGLPVSCRPENAKAEAGTALDHVAVFLTRDVIRTLRETSGHPAALSDGTVRRQLDFDRHVFPLIVLEMAYVYYRTALGVKAGTAMKAAAKPHVSAFLRGGCPVGEEGVEQLLAPLEACVTSLLHVGVRRFEWRRVFEPLPVVARDGAAWRTAALDYLAKDLARAACGNVLDPFKAASDAVWRDLRGVLCEAVDRGGLTASSQRRFAEIHLRHYNRLSNGAALEPMRKVLALAEAGVLDLSVGPKPTVEPVPGAPSFRVRGTATGAEREVDVLVEARSDPFHAALDERPLHPAMLQRGLTRLWHNPGEEQAEDFIPGALDLDERFHPREAGGHVEVRLTFLGGPAEGLVYFGQTAARPHAGSPVLEAVGRWAEDLVDEIVPRRSAVAAAL